MMGDPPAKEYNTYMMQVNHICHADSGHYQKKYNDDQLFEDDGGDHLERQSFDEQRLQEGQPQNGSGQYAQVMHLIIVTHQEYLFQDPDENNYPDIPHPCPSFPPLYPSLSPLANGVFVPPACGKDDKTIGENDYG